VIIVRQQVMGGVAAGTPGVHAALARSLSPPGGDDN
jgi:hypothetical protein